MPLYLAVGMIGIYCHFFSKEKIAINSHTISGSSALLVLLVVRYAQKGCGLI